MTEPQFPPVPSRLIPSGGAAGGDATTTPEGYYPPSPAGGARQPGPPEPSGPGFNRQDLIKNYANLVARTWVDETYVDLLLADPVGTINAAGMPTAAGATIRIIQCKLTGTGKIQDQVHAWIEGNRTGLYDFWLPIRPEDIEISDLGGLASESGDTYCCCCTPCCCCT